jgi:GAF domain-containing protein
MFSTNRNNVILRNNLTEGAFTTDLVNVLNLLAAQAAISIQNANMYMHMQKAKEQAQHAIQAQRYNCY